MQMQVWAVEAIRAEPHHQGCHHQVLPLPRPRGAEGS